MCGTALSGGVVVDGDADELGSGFDQVGGLLDGRGDVGGVGVGHRLHDDRGFGADFDGANFDRDGLPAVDFRHGEPPFQFTGHWPQGTEVLPA